MYTYVIYYGQAKVEIKMFTGITASVATGPLLLFPVIRIQESNYSNFTYTCTWTRLSKTSISTAKRVYSLEFQE